jgi:hypothetical protein
LRKALLAAQCLPLQTSALAAKSTRTNGFRLLLGKLLALLLAHSSLRSANDAANIRIHIPASF